jgi:TonB-dependent starch-binding outer membrane protein SusC
LDVNDDGSYDNLDMSFMNSTDRTFFGGIGNTLRLGNIELSVLFQFSKQKAGKFIQGLPGDQQINQLTDVMKRWRNEGDVSDVQRFDNNPYGDYGFAYNYFLPLSSYNSQDASFVRLKTASVGYNISGALLERIRIRNARVYLQGQNLFTISNYTGLDPETGSSSLPPLRVVMVGLQVKM